MRMVCISSALGMNPEAFFPKSFDPGYELSPTLKSLAPLRKDFTVISHMDPPNIYTRHGAMNSLLSGVDAKQASPGENISIDQMAAAHVGYQTRFPSVHISLGGTQGASWTNSGIKVREETNPMDLFRKLFVTDPEAARQARKAELDQQASVLDLVRGQAKRLENSINPSDRAKLDEYLTAIREAEFRIQGMQRWQDVSKPKVEFDDDVNPHSSMDYPTLSPVMFDLLYLAIQSDSSRVFTAGFGMHNHVIELDGVTTGYHGLTHHGRLPQKLKQLRIIDAFYIDQMSRFMAKLKTGQQTPLNNLYTTMLQKFGVEVDRFNNATGTFEI